jgi:hypothetical protein
LDHVDRRTFLASAATVVSTAAAGCSAIDRRTEHTNPAVETEDQQGDNGKYLSFTEGGDDLATVGVDPKFTPLPNHLHVWIWHREGTRPQSLVQRFAAPDGDGTPPKLALHGPFMGGSEPYPSVSLYEDGAAAVVEVHRFGDLADETVFMNLSVSRWPESARRLVVESTVELTEQGIPDRTHVLDGGVEFTAGSESGD